MNNNTTPHFSLAPARVRRDRVWFACMVAIVSMLACTRVSSVQAAEIAAPLSTPDAGTALMQRVAAGYAQDVAGVVAVRSHSDLEIKAPIFGRHIIDDSWYIFQNGSLVASSRKADPRKPPLHDPYVASYLTEYTYHLAPCPACAPGTSAIAYESAFRDVQHAHGTFIVDDASAHILRGSETPYKLPWPTKSGQLDATWAESANGWFPVEIDGAFVGNVGPFVGRAFYAQKNAMIERYASVAEATSALTMTTQAALVTQNGQ